jgi:hypothetical protein
VTVKTVLQALVDGKSILVRDEWTKFCLKARLQNGGYAYCATGALREALTMPDVDGIGGLPIEHWAVFESARRALDMAAGKFLRKAGSALAPKGFFIERFNDHVATTKLDVLAVYDLAIEDEQNQIFGAAERRNYRPPYEGAAFVATSQSGATGGDEGSPETARSCTEDE